MPLKKVWFIPYPKIGKILLISNLENMQKNAINKLISTIGTTIKLHLLTVLNPKQFAITAATKKNNNIRQMLAFSK